MGRKRSEKAPFCLRGHDRTLPGALRPNGACIACCIERDRNAKSEAARERDDVLARIRDQRPDRGFPVSISATRTRAKFTGSLEPAKGGYRVRAPLIDGERETLTFVSSKYAGYRFLDQWRADKEAMVSALALLSRLVVGDASNVRQVEQASAVVSAR